MKVVQSVKPTDEAGSSPPPVPKLIASFGIAASLIRQATGKADPLLVTALNLHFREGLFPRIEVPSAS